MVSCDERGKGVVFPSLKVWSDDVVGYLGWETSFLPSHGANVNGMSQRSKAYEEVNPF